MTFVEIFERDHPKSPAGSHLGHCPEEFGYEPYRDCQGMSCPECWQREAGEVEAGEGEAE